MKEKEGKTLILNDKGILLICVLILSLTFLLGFMTCNKRKQEQNVTTFTREELERIDQLQSMEDQSGSGADVYAYKDKDGNLMIGWEGKDSK